MYIVTIDSGTTNTRVRLWKEMQIIAQTNEAIGVRDVAISNSKDNLSKAIKQALMTVLARGGLTPHDHVTIVASGMITSNIGLCEIPHLIAPVSQKKLADSMVQKVLPEIIDQPIWFIPGIKNDVADVTFDNCEWMDMMRGEEVEAVGILSLLNISGPTLIILPGSHSKFVKLNEHHEIVGSATTLAGEFIDIITQRTILSSSLDHQFASSIEETYLLKGAEYCQRVGITRSCFTIRLFDLFTSLTINQKANFLLGIVLYADLQAIEHSQALNCAANTKIVIGGKKILRQALATLIAHHPFFCGEVIEFDEESHPPLSAVGAIALINQRNE